MKKWLALISIILAAASILAACGGGNSVEPTGEVVEVTIRASNFEFDVTEIRANLGDTIQVTFINDQGLHDVKFNGYNKIAKGNETISFIANKKGEFDYICDIFCGTGHADMKGKLIVL